MRNIQIIIAAILLGLLASCKTTTTTNVQPTKEQEDYAKIYPIFKKYEGIAYRYGGTDERGFDCSGFVGAVYRESFGLDLPRSTELLWDFGNRVSDKKVGDIIYFSPNADYNHVGIYIGERRFIHSSSSKGVMISYLSDPYWAAAYVMTRRVK